jgi:UDP-glucose 4-epimerase
MLKTLSHLKRNCPSCMKLLITGATGFLGTPLVTGCITNGYDVVIISRRQVSVAGVRCVVADFANKASLEAAKAAVGPIDVIVHLGALVYKKPDEDVATNMAQVNIAGTINVLEVFGKEAKLIVNGSTAEVYGLPDVEGPVVEGAIPHPASNYGASKLAAEYFCNIFAARQNIPVVNLRFSVMYGAPDPIARAIPNFIKKAVRNEPLEIYGGEELRDYLHVDDAVQSILCAFKAAVSGTYNVGSGKGISVKDAAQAIVSTAKSTSTLSVLPRQKKAADLVFDSSALERDFGYKPQYIFPAGLEKQIEWEKQQV